MKFKLIIASFIIEVLTLRVWYTCQRFTNIFHYSSLNVALQIATYSNSFIGMPHWFVRLFHNKLIQIPTNFFRFYLQFWDIRFGINWFSILGYIGILFAFYYLISLRIKKWHHWLILGIIGILPCIEIIFQPNLPIQVISIYLWFPYILFSLYGLYQYLKDTNKKKRQIFVFLLLLLSCWWLVYLPFDLPRYCVK